MKQAKPNRCGLLLPAISVPKMRFRLGLGAHGSRLIEMH